MKLFVVGLDGMSPELLTDIVNRGHMPFTRDLCGQSATGDLRSTRPPVTGPAWTSYATGCNPEKHGVFDFVVPGDRITDNRSLTAADIGVETYYEILEENGFDTVHVNLPVSWPPLTDAPTITSLLTGDDDPIHPARIQDDTDGLDEYKIAPDATINRNSPAYIEEIRDIERRRFSHAKRLMETQPWDLFFVLFSGTDWICHKYYSELLDGTAPENAVSLFTNIDKYLRELVEMTPEDTNVLVLSDHGFRRIERIFNINEWLTREGYLSLTGETNYEKEKHAGESVDGRQIDLPLRRVMAIEPIAKLLRTVYSRVRGYLPVSFSVKRAPDPTISQAFAPTFELHGIYINTTERFEDGTVTSEKYDQIVDELVTKLSAVDDPSTGDRVFNRVARGDEVFESSLSDTRPDVIFEPSSMYLLSASLRERELFRDGTDDYHSETGICLMTGPDIDEEAGVTGTLVDIAPTILHAFNLPVPAHMDGEVLDMFATDSPVSDREIRVGEERYRDRDQIDSVDESTQDRLRNLGYL